VVGQVPDLWSECQGNQHVVARNFEAWRVVEGQHVVSTRKLVATLAEQEVLEALLDEAKPLLPDDPLLRRLHYLLFTPFRYPPLRHGSRFGVRLERGIWYGALARSTALAERAYYRLLFLAGTAAELAPLCTEETVFRAAVASQRVVDFTAPNFAAVTARISAPDTYAHSQPVGAHMREANVEACLFLSARDPDHGVNCALFAPAFASPQPIGPETWVCTARTEAIDFRNRVLGLGVEFARGVFEVGGTLPQPGV